MGQVSTDGQFRWDGTQWAPLARGERQPTAWTRPMQLAAAGLLVAQAVWGVASTLLFVTKDTVQQAFEQAGTQVPQGMTQDQFVSASLIAIYVSVALFAVVELVCAALAFFGWRWAFWVVFVVMAIFSLFAVLSIPALFRGGPGVVTELLGLGNVGLFAWMVAGLVKFGPWAMKKPGA